MVHRVLIVLFCVSLPLLAGQPGEKAKGVDFTYKSDSAYKKFTLTVSSVKTTADMNLADPAKNKFTLQMDGSLEVPPKADIAAVIKQLRVMTIEDEGKNDITARCPAATATPGQTQHNAIINGVGQVDFPKTEMPCDVSRIGSIKLAAEVVQVTERDKAVLPAIVMEDNKDIGNGISVRITKLSMSKDRELTVEIAYERASAEAGSPFIEKIYALDKDKKSFGGGRWTEGDPFGKTGAWKCKFKLEGEQIHQYFRLEIATKSEAKRVEFDLKKIFRPELPKQP